MAYVDIPKDLNRIQSKVLLNLTKRQLMGFGAGAILGGITFFTTRVAVGNTIATFLLRSWRVNTPPLGALPNKINQAIAIGLH